MRVVIDTNVLVSGIFWSGTPCKVLDAWAADKIVAFASAGILEEYFEVIDRLASRCGREDLAKRWKTCLFDHVELIAPNVEYYDCRDRDDAKFVECALAANAEYIISGDDDLLSLEEVNGIQVVTPAQFLSKL